MKKNPAVILGISVSHEASAALCIEGAIVAAASEERFTRVKNDIGYPKNAIEFCLRFAKVQPDKIDLVVLAGEKFPYENFLYRREATFSVDDWIKEQNFYWYPKLIEKKDIDYHSALQDQIHVSLDERFLPEGLLNMKGDARHVFARIIQDHLGVSAENIVGVSHEVCHQSYAYYASPSRDDGVMLTVEGGGDYTNATISRVKKGTFRQESFTTQNHLGHLYRYTTLLLGMKPNEHEYKVMGLAPYASSQEVEKVLRKLNRLFEVVGDHITLSRSTPDFYFSLQKLFQGCRFDGIAGGLQAYTEKMLCDWVLHLSRKFDAETFYFSGGVAQNIKACQSIGKLDCVNSLYVMPSSGDGSLSIGACYAVLMKMQNEVGIAPPESFYLGPEYTQQEIGHAISARTKGKGYTTIYRPTLAWVVHQLVEAKVIARFSGRMEFGQRALGNRSILADPRHVGIIEHLNRMIKHRDFWMPFTPSILAPRANDYVVNQKKLLGKYMTLAFDSTKKAQRDLAAALHPADKTVRPQIVSREDNPLYFALLQAFERETGVGGLLNTSFNMHGEPMVCSPEDAVDVFNRSEIDILLFDHVAICRMSNS